MPDGRGDVKRVSLSSFYNASQFRIDTWNRLKNLSWRLAEKISNGNTAKNKAAALKILDQLAPIEMYWAFPGYHHFQNLYRALEAENYVLLNASVSRITASLMSGLYRRKHIDLEAPSSYKDTGEIDEDLETERSRQRPYFETLIVDTLSPNQQKNQIERLNDIRRKEDKFTYKPVFVPSLEDALIAVLFNYNIQSVVIRSSFALRSKHTLSMLDRYLKHADIDDLDNLDPAQYSVVLANAIASVRPEIDIFLVLDHSVEEVAGVIGAVCRRVFYDQEDFMELHLNILRGVDDRYQTPFFTALREYSEKPTGVFHALPISRGKSIIKSNWIKDMGEFYGMNIFLAETSATSGGLDSLLEPHGPIKKAHELSARAYGSKLSFFSTNGTSTCNKIVVQALVRPGDIVLVDRDCHKSHHYGMVLSGAHVVYLDSYPLHELSMYGAVPMHEIKSQLLRCKKAGMLDRVKMLLLTNCTFDGIVYNVQQVMEECLAIKPDLVFLWDEAWFGFARFAPTYRQRTAMHSAKVLQEKYKSPAYRKRYDAYLEEMKDIDPDDEKALLERTLMPDPDKVRVRVYSTQSTHKTLTALRQGSIIHIRDQDYKSKVEEAFHEAYMTHTSTSPNYQILASLDLGRRQVELEGFELVKKQIEMAMVLRQSIFDHPLLSKHFRVLTVGEMVPKEYRLSGIESYYDPEHGWHDIQEAWAKDEFSLDATRVTLFVGSTGMDGDTFKNEVLMDKYGIQINKTSRNTVLFMTNIGTTRSSVAYLIEVLVKIAKELEVNLEDMSPAEHKLHKKKVDRVTKNLPPLPDFSRFHDAFRPTAGQPTHEGDIRKAFFMAYEADDCEYLGLDDGALDQAMDSGREVVSATFVIPYPPGFPILVPGQVASKEIIEYLQKLDVKEIHGFRPELGLHVFTEEALKRVLKS